SLVYVAMDLMSRLFSPHELNPGGANPLREILANCIDFDRVAKAPIKLFVTATLRMIALLRQVANPGDCEGALWAGMRIHRVASEALTELGSSSKVNAEWDFLSMLRDQGRFSAEAFLDANGQDL